MISPSRSIKQLLCLASIALLLCSCHNLHKAGFAQLSEGLPISRVNTGEHQLLLVQQARRDDTDELHVYIEGDGLPWIKTYRINNDPTPHYPLALDLMKQDRSAAIYLGRPCYFNSESYGLQDTHCHFSLWTNARYSEEVIDTMVAALRQLLTERRYSQLTLIGYSGGGTIATLMAEQMREVDRLITVAANLDIDAWTSYHHYSPLNQSRRITAMTQLPENLAQIHYAGGDDEVVPPQLNKVLLQQLGQKLTVIEGFTHSCCWAEHWPELLHPRVTTQH